MARYYKKRFKARKKASSRRYRRYRKYKRYYRRNRRRYRRKISKPEVKFVTVTAGAEFEVIRPADESTGEPKAFVLFSPGDVFGIGGRNQAGLRRNMEIPQGVGWGSRIGARVRPVKLRIFGNINMPNTDLYNVPRSASFRCLVVQMRYHQLGAGESANIPAINEAGFSDWNPVYTADGNMLPETHRRFFYQYYIDQFEFGGQRQLGVSVANFGINQFQSKSPFREGFGRNVKVLYDHVFTVGTQQAQSQNVNFRIKTKCPNVLVWNYPKPPEPGHMILNADNVSVRNPIYICWFFVPHNMHDPGAAIHGETAYDLNYTAQLYYVDP